MLPLPIPNGVAFVSLCVPKDGLALPLKIPCCTPSVHYTLLLANSSCSFFKGFRELMQYKNLAQRRKPSAIINRPVASNTSIHKNARITSDVKKVNITDTRNNGAKIDNHRTEPSENYQSYHNLQRTQKLVRIRST